MPKTSKKTVPAWMVNVEKFPGRMTGASSSGIASCRDLAGEAWGERADTAEAGIASFAYLWRRFGPPPIGSDPHKDICTYYLGTPLDKCLLSVSPRGCWIGVGYLIPEKMQHEIHRPTTEWWKRFGSFAAKNSDHKNIWDASTDKELMARAQKAIGPLPPRHYGDWRKAPKLIRSINRALLDAMRELLRPVPVRDSTINILGICDPWDADAPASELAGYGVPLGVMRRYAKQDA